MQFQDECKDIQLREDGGGYEEVRAVREEEGRAMDLRAEDEKQRGRGAGE